MDMQARGMASYAIDKAEDVLKEIDDAKTSSSTLKERLDALVIGAGGTYPAVNYYSDLPATSQHASQIYVVLYSSGVWFVNRKPGGLYYSTGTAWIRLGDFPEWFKSGNFEIYDSLDESKAVKFNVSGVTTGQTRVLTIPDKDGTVVLSSDLSNYQTKITVSTSAPTDTDGVDGDIWLVIGG